MATLDCGSSSSTTSTIESSSYDVFLNFRGEDTRKSFTSVLHLFLQDKGFKVFIDNERLRIGEPIGPALRKAIEESQISIPIISEQYTNSKWCLRELAHIVQCMRSKGQIVLPVYFYVDPSQVRNQTGSFKKDLEDHENNFGSDIVQSWREALSVVGNIKGVVLDKNTEQAEVFKSVAERVKKVLKSEIPFLESKFQIGIDFAVREMLSLLDFDSGNTQFVGICGPGGSGKTTIAKTVYRHILLEEKSSHFSFEGHSFLSDIAQYAKQSMGLVALQKQLLKDVFKIESDIADHHRGKKLVKDKLGEVKILLVLDDVEKGDQVDALAGGLNWFGKGSKIIITTRDEHILNVSKVDRNKIFPPRMLDPRQSLELFCLHAFPEAQPTDDYMKLAHEVADFSGGLPLTLEVLGKTLSDVEGLDAWRAMISSWKIIPHEEVQRRLRISYDNLEYWYEKAIFLDAACFFIGWEEKTVMSIWEACGYFPEAAIGKLVKRSLLKFEKSNGRCLRMHAQIQEMGRAIVREENPMKPSKRSRLWSTDDILEVFDEHKGNELIEGMILPLDMPSTYLSTEHFEKFNIRFLDINSKDFTGDFSCLPQTLRWLRWIGCPRDILPTNFYHKKLAYLSLSNSVISQAWNIRLPSENERFQKLKVLDLSDCVNLSKSPNFLWFPCLEDLNLGHCRYLDELDNSIGELSRLKVLVLKFCDSLKRLPDSIGTLKSLVRFDMTSTSIEELPDSICELSSLKEFILQSSWKLKELPKNIGGLQSLVVLKLTRAFGIKELPDSVGLLMEKIKELDVEDCFLLTKLPRSMGGMSCLEYLNLKGTEVSELPDDFSTLSNLVELKIAGGVECPPADLSHWRKLKILQFCYCKKLVYLPELPSSLVVLGCISCYLLVGLPDLRSLKSLKTLKLDYCPKLNEIPGLEGIEWLEELSAPESYDLTHTSRKILGQGRSISQELRKICSLKADNVGICNKGLILYLVFEFDDWYINKQEGESVSVYLDIESCIRQEGKPTCRCFHTLRIEDVEYTAEGDTVYIHHFKGFDWFGIPLQGKDSIEIVKIHRSDPYYKHGYAAVFTPPCEVKYWKLLVDDAANHENPNRDSSAMMVKDFFQWNSRFLDLLRRAKRMLRPTNK